MEQKPKKTNPAPFVMGFIVLLLVIVFVIALNQGLADSFQGILLLAALGFLIVTGILRIRKIVRDGKSDAAPSASETAPASPAASAPVPASGTPVPSVPVGSASVSNPIPGQKLAEWFKTAPKNQRTAVAAGGGILVLAVLILIVSFAAGAFSEPPTGTWIQEGYEERVRYEFYEDETWAMFDYGELSQSGYYVQTGSHVDLHILYYYTSNYEDGYETAYYVIHGDRMTSGGVVLNRTGD